MLSLLLNFISGYLLGSLTFCRFLAEWRGKDLGNNFGAMIYYSKTKDLFGTIICGILDGAKGAVSYLLFGPLGAVGALAGHLWSIFFGFRGGRGGAVTMAVFLFADPRITAIVVLYSLIRFFLIKERRIREKLDQKLRLLLLLVLPFMPYDKKLLLWAMIALITLKYWREGI